MTARIAPNVERGAEFLDAAIGPDWDLPIDLAKLDLSSTCNCVLGQLNRDAPQNDRYDRGLQRFGIGRPDRLGFITAGGRQTFERLTDSWKALIRARRKARREEARV